MNTRWGTTSDRVYFDATMEWMCLYEAIGRPQHVVFNSWFGPTTDGGLNRPGASVEQRLGAFGLGSSARQEPSAVSRRPIRCGAGGPLSSTCDTCTA